MKSGESFEWRGQELFAARTMAGCRRNETDCYFADFAKAKCMAEVGNPSCKNIIFVTKQQYLELRLLGEI